MNKFKTYFITLGGALALVCTLATFARGQMFSDGLHRLTSVRPSIHHQ